MSWEQSTSSCVSELTIFAVSLVAEDTSVLLRIATSSDLLLKHLINVLTYLLACFLTCPVIVQRVHIKNRHQNKFQ